MLDFHLARIKATEKDPDNYQDRFNCDGSYWLKTYAKYRSPSQFNRLIAAIRSGHISSQLNCVVNTYGAQSAESVIRGMYYAGQLERRYDLKFTMASAMENNTLPLGLASLWAGSGAKYSWKSVGGYGSQLSQESMKHRKYQLYRAQGMDGQSVLTKWYAQKGSFGGYAECRVQIKGPASDTAKQIGGVINNLFAFCDTVSPGSKYPYNVAGAFGFGHDDLQTFVSGPFSMAAQNKTNPATIVRVSNEEDFFKDMERSYPKIPKQSVSFGNEWELLCASMNETTAEVRRAVEKLRSAEALAAIVAKKDAAFGDDLLAARDLAWDALGLYWEHNWTADGPVPTKARAVWQVELKNNITGYVDSLYAESISALGKQLKAGKLQRFFVFNPLGWTRSDFADFAFSGSGPVNVIDLATHSEVKSQVILKNGHQYIRILASGVPSVGYKVYELHQHEPLPVLQAAVVQGEYISNAYYKIRLKRSGVITEIYDKKAAGKQLVKLTNGKYLNDLGVTDLNEGQPLQIENAGPVSVTLKAVSTVPVLHTVRLTLFANSPRIDIENSIDTNFADNKSWAFSFDMKDHVTRHEEVGAILTVKKEMDGGNYADQNARYDWQTFNHFADLSNNHYGVTLANMDCSFFKLGQSTVDSLWAKSAQLNALAGGRIDTKKEDNGILGIKDQFGQNHFHYHFALTTHQKSFSAVDAMKFALDTQNPLSTGQASGGDAADAKLSYSLLQVSDPGVLLWAVKPAEEGIGKGTIVRLWNLNPFDTKATISTTAGITNAWQTTHIETNIHQLRPSAGLLQTDLKLQQIKTFRLNDQHGEGLK
jgi:alpha-mannosidase